MNLKAILAAALVLVTGSAWAQMAAKPGSEVKKLDYFVGSWTTEGTVAQGPWGAGGKFSSTSSTEWMPGNFFVQAHSDFKMPPEIGGEGKETSIMGYDTDQNLYTYDAFNSLGRRDTSKGTVSGDTWTWSSTQTYEGQEIKQKMTIKVLSPSSYNMKFELSMDGTNWMTFMEGKATKK
jgi:hypothetical protein